MLRRPPRSTRTVALFPYTTLCRSTWLVATRLIEISGASRELTEGFAALLAAAVLVSVGIWMHGKSQADAWQRYIRTTVSNALSRGSAWFLFGLSFLIVYREAFETVLFYAALWSQGNHTAVLARSEEHTSELQSLMRISYAVFCL